MRNPLQNMVPKGFDIFAVLLISIPRNGLRVNQENESKVCILHIVDCGPKWPTASHEIDHKTEGIIQPEDIIQDRMHHLCQ